MLLRNAAPQFSGIPSINPVLRLLPSNDYDGGIETGFNGTKPTDPLRTVAKPAAHWMQPPRQVVTGSMRFDVMAMANDNGTMMPSQGIESVTFNYEGSVQAVTVPHLRQFVRQDGSKYTLPVYSINIARPTSGAVTEGDSRLVAVIKSTDGAFQERVIEMDIGLYAERHDHKATVASDGSGDYATFQDAEEALALLNAERPWIELIDANDYTINGGTEVYVPKYWCTVTGTQPITFKENPPADESENPKMRPTMGRLHFKGSNITLDFVNSLVFDPLSPDAYPWLDGCNVTQSEGREDLYRLVPRNIIPALFVGSMYATDAKFTEVNDAFDKALLARGNTTDRTWSDVAQNAQCFVGNRCDRHSNTFFTTNIDSINLSYSGAGVPTYSIRNGPRRLALRIDGADVAEFTFSTAKEDFIPDNNYTVSSTVDWINSQPGWSALLLDNSRAAGFLSPPGTTNGAPEEDIDLLNPIPTHIDLHGDGYQATIGPTYPENNIFAFNLFIRAEMQNIFVQKAPGVRDTFFVCNAFSNVIESTEVEARTDTDGIIDHGAYVHNTNAWQRTSLPVAGTAASRVVIANNVARRISVTNAADLATGVTVVDNHSMENVAIPPEAVGTSLGGDSFNLFVDADAGDFKPAGLLLTNGAVPRYPYDLNGNLFQAAFDCKGAVRADVPLSPPAVLPSFVSSSQEQGTNGVLVGGALIATGDNKYIATMVGAGTSDAVNDITCDIIGTGGQVSMTRLAILGTQNDDPALSLEAFAVFGIDEASLPGDGPYMFQASATGTNVPDKLGLLAMSAKDVTNPPTVSAIRGNTVSITPTAEDSLVFAFLGSATTSSAADMTGATQVENKFEPGNHDGFQGGWARHGTTELTITNTVNARNVSVALAFAP